MGGCLFNLAQVVVIIKLNFSLYSFEISLNSYINKNCRRFYFGNPCSDFFADKYITNISLLKKKEISETVILNT